MLQLATIIPGRYLTVGIFPKTKTFNITDKISSPTEKDGSVFTKAALCISL